jgi:superfamily II DNA or RNA helicase
VLRDLSFQATYRSDIDDIGEDFLSTALSQADRYDRAAGYFSSTAMRSVWRGLRAFVERKGQMRLVVSPELSVDDIEAISAGYAERDTIVNLRLGATVESLEMLPEQYSVQVLSWLIAQKRLTIKIATPEDLGSGIYHEKIGVIQDSEYTVAFTGSLNETGAAFERNFESIDVYCSWLEPLRVSLKQAAFEKLWANKTNKVKVIDFPSALRERLIKIAPRDFPESPLVVNLKPESTLRPYQSDAVNAWRLNANRGIFEMATGTGKTVTAIDAIRTATADLVSFVVIAAPLTHLVEQWSREIKERLSVDLLVCFGETAWRDSLSLSLKRLNAFGKPERPLVVITTYDTCESTDFRAIVCDANIKAMFVADEMHNITTERSTRIFSDLFIARLGLSATPRRHLDESGTEKIFKWFGGVVFEFGLKEAIERGYLTPYNYFPIFCELSDVEAERYERIAEDLDAITADKLRDRIEVKQKLLLLSQMRESLLETAEDKLKKFEAVIRTKSFEKEGLNLVYVHHEFLEVVQLFLGREMHFTNSRFTARESLTERKSILDGFARKAYAFLIAIRCLDEGVDIPATRTAFILNSSANPKEFIQRRGRVLRLWPGKESANIYDFVVLPRRAFSRRDELLIERELGRFYEFADLSKNRSDAMSRLEQAQQDFKSGVGTQ